MLSQYVIGSRSGMSRPQFESQVSTISSDPPAWLNLEELQQTIKKEFPTFQSIKNYRSRSEYNAQRLQLQIGLADRSTRSVSYLVKSKDYRTLKFPQAQSFRVEQHMHQEVLPALEGLYKDCQRAICFAPSSHSGGSSLFLEDLQAKGYRLANLPKGLDQPSMEVILSKLAAYHAATARYVQLKPVQLNELVQRKEPSAEVQQLKSWLQRKFHESLRANNLWQYEDRVKSYQKSMADLGEPNDSKKSFSAILVGACWANNILGQFDAFDQLKDAVFSDFSGARCGPVVHDLLQLLLTAPAAKTELFDGFLRFYTDELTSFLKILNFKGKLPTLTDIQLDLLNYGYWAFGVVTEILPLTLADFGCEDMEELFKLPNYSTEIQALLPWLENRGYFEVE